MDILLFVLFAGVQLALAGLGVYVSLKPQPTKRHRSLIIIFLILAVGAISVGIIQQARSKRAQDQLQGQIADIQKKIVTPPTATENAAAVVALQEKQPKTPPQTAIVTPSKPQRPHTLQHNPLSPEPPASEPEGPTPNPQPTGAPAAATLRVSQSPSPDPSTRPDAPVKTRVVVQTDRDFPTLRIAVECDQPLVDGNVTSAGVDGMSSMMMTTRGIVGGHPNIYILTYQSATPPFGPSNPLIFNLWSKNAIHCSRATTF